MKHINVEIVGYEYSVYGGEDGHYCGTAVKENEIVDILEIPSEYDNVVRVTISDSNRVCLIDSRDVPYWDHSTLYVREPNTGCLGIKVDNILYDVALYKMGGEKIGNRIDEFYNITCNLNYGGMLLGEFKEILRNL